MRRGKDFVDARGDLDDRIFYKERVRFFRALFIKREEGQSACVINSRVNGERQVLFFLCSGDKNFSGLVRRFFEQRFFIGGSYRETNRVIQREGRIIICFHVETDKIHVRI